MASSITGVTNRSHCFLSAAFEEAPSWCGNFLSFFQPTELQGVQGHQIMPDYVEMLQHASILTEFPCLCSDEWLSQYNCVVHNAQLTRDL